MSALIILYFPACDYSWSVGNNEGIKKGHVKVHLDNDSKNATVILKAYDFDPSSEWFGFGLSYDSKMVNIMKP